MHHIVIRESLYSGTIEGVLLSEDERLMRSIQQLPASR